MNRAMTKPTPASSQSDQDPCCSSTKVEKLIANSMDPDHCADAQAGLDPCWSQMHCVGFVICTAKIKLTMLFFWEKVSARICSGIEKVLKIHSHLLIIKCAVIVGGNINRISSFKIINIPFFVHIK
jgi:hypothetical protein